MQRSDGAAEPPMSRRATALLWTAMIVGLAGAGTAFAFKVAEFLFTMSADDLPGFADQPVTVYFFVAAGWLAILCWCFLTGKFRDLERVKRDMLAREEEYERRGE